MQITGIIAEYNPLHLGHRYHIEQTKAATGADYIITILSGDYVQRGLPAILDKHTRARMALEAGSDLVIELPVPYALSSGEGFAFGGVSLLHQLGCVDSLSFGSEAGTEQLDQLVKIARVLQSEALFTADLMQTAEVTPYHATYQSALKQGMTHPKARLHALLKTHPELDTGVLDGHSNNMLALEYLKAIYRLQSAIEPVTIERKGQAYLDDCVFPNSNVCTGKLTSHAFASATAIREALKQHNLETLSTQVPACVAEILIQAHSANTLLFAEDFSPLLHYKLLSLSKAALTDYLEVTPDFANKITGNLGAFESFTQFANLLWTKDTTYARVCRNLMHILLDIRADTHDVREPVPYARVLGFRKDSAPLLSEIKKSSCIPLVTKLADARESLEPDAYRLLELDMKAAHIYDSVVQHKAGRKMVHEMQKQIVIV